MDKSDAGVRTEVGESAKVVMASPENQFNFLPNVLPESPNEVVWHFASQNDTDEVIFDDVNHSRAFIVSEMSAALNFQGPTRTRYLDGFEWDFSAFRDYDDSQSIEDSEKGLLKFQGRGFTRAPHVANFASAVSEEAVAFAAQVAGLGNANTLAPALQWNVPSYGRLLGGARVEPIAAGGIKAKGLWLDGNDWVEYLIEPQPSATDLADSPWFVTLSLELEVDLQASGWWRLVTWPDGSYLEARADGLELRLTGTTGSTTLPLSAPLALENGKWSTLALESKAGAAGIEVFVDGLRLASIGSGLEGFRMQVGTMTVGSESDGLIGWTDDFKVFGASPTYEEVCNHAGGTLRGFDDNGSVPADLITLANAYVVGSGDVHLDITSQISALGGSPASYELYVCERPSTFAGAKTCLGKTHGTMPAECVRPSINGRHQQLVWDLPRPDSVTNPFCLSCHVAGNPSETMQPSQALNDLAPLIMHEDFRRQPLQPFPFLLGAVPEDYFGPGDPGPLPPAPVVPDPINLDEKTNP